MQISSARTPPVRAAFSFAALAREKSGSCGPRTWHFQFVVGCIAFAPLLTACVSAPDEFEAQRRQAVKDSRTPEARAYERGFYPAIGQDLARLLKKCTSEFPAAAGDAFELVFRIDHWGEPKAILVNPVTDVSGCVASGFWYFTFPHPAERFSKTGLVLLLPLRIE